MRNFCLRGTVPNIALYPELEMQDGYVCADEQMRTSIDGVYAVGDIRVKTVRQISTAVCDGTFAAITVFAK